MATKYFPTGKPFEAVYSPHHRNTKSGIDRPWSAYVNGVLLRNARGVGRSFATEDAALKAARAALSTGGKGGA
jgi:hypothetical protein